MFTRNSQKRFSHRPGLTLLILLCALSLFASCSNRGAGSANGGAGPATREVVDGSGRRVRVPQRPERIITLAPNLTEIVYAVGAGPRLVGNTTYCDYPQEARAVEKVGDTLHPSIERIIALRPQLILISTASQLEAFTKQLDEQNIAVYITDPHDLEGVFKSIEAIGDLVDERERAASVVNALRSRASSIEERVSKQKPLSVFYQLSAEPLYTAGRDSFITDLVRRAGGVSVTANVPGAWPRYSDEAALAARPEAVIMATGDSMGAQANVEVAEPLRRSPAVQNNRVYKINGDFLSRPGPRLVDGLEQMARALHPEAFKD
ncbi:MAG TPA: cobalamin-binding protein [Pyrinomonadaceae bacterium]|nr:cobalamin-binding protein [Pyrinomonadaceae bacterium]